MSNIISFFLVFIQTLAHSTKEKKICFGEFVALVYIVLTEKLQKDDICTLHLYNLVFLVKIFFLNILFINNNLLRCYVIFNEIHIIRKNFKLTGK